MVNVNKFVLFDRVTCKNGKNGQHIVGYQVDEETIIPLLIMLSKNIISNRTITQLIQCHSVFLLSQSRCFHMETPKRRLNCSDLTTEHIKEECKYINNELKRTH